MKKILVTGGAGYIGSNICKSLLDSGYPVAVFDDFSTGLRRRVRNLPVEIHKGSILDREALLESMQDVDAVIHLAAKKSVEESVSNPLKYYQVNVTGSLNVIGAMLARNIKKIVFSSTAVVYKSTARQKLQEGDSKEPLSPYAHSKLLFEDFLDSLREAKKVSSISLRYFNVVGAGGIGLGDNARDNLVPKTFKALKEGKTPEIYGIDYPTDDGTCIRDYIHVTDLADAHVQALDLVQNKKISEKFNVGSGKGYSVKEVMTQIQESTGIHFSPKILPRRKGDPAHLVAGIDKIAADMHWYPRRDLKEMIDSAWLAEMENVTNEHP